MVKLIQRNKQTERNGQKQTRHQHGEQTISQTRASTTTLPHNILRQELAFTRARASTGSPHANPCTNPSTHAPSRPRAPVVCFFFISVICFLSFHSVSAIFLSLLSLPSSLSLVFGLFALSSLISYLSFLFCPFLSLSLSFSSAPYSLSSIARRFSVSSLCLWHGRSGFFASQQQWGTPACAGLRADHAGSGEGGLG